MLRLASSAALLLLVAAAYAARADDFPYSAYIAADDVDVVAGPGHRFYTTERLPRGAKVEIYREESSGWLAIQPPEGSFSWVPAEFVERLDDASLGRVKESTGAWVGTTVEHVTEHHQQVTLKAGELVQILGEKSAASKSGVERRWLKIAPPAGEYRWVYLRDVSRQQPEDAVGPAPSELVEAILMPALSQRERENQEPQRLEVIGNAIALRSIEERPTRLDRAVEPSQYRSVTTSAGSAPVSPDGFVPRKRRADDMAPIAAPANKTISTPFVRPNLDPSARLAATMPNTMRSISPTTTSGLNGDQFDWQLNQIEIDLSLMVAQDRSQWNLAALRRRVETLVESGADPAARGRARLVLEKIKQFEDAFDRDMRTVSATGSTLGQPASGRGASENLKSADGVGESRYDAQGLLKPVVSRKSDKPVA